MRPSLFWDVTQSGLVFTDVSAQHIDPIFKGQAVQEETASRLKVETIFTPETPVTNFHSTLFKIPEERIFYSTLLHQQLVLAEIVKFVKYLYR
jgi:hypothetical protein